MILVLDSSAAVAASLRLAGHENYLEALEIADWTLVPELFVAEVTNALWKYKKFGKLSKTECEQALGDALALPDEIVSGAEMAREVFSLACSIGKPAYDLFFLILARRNDAVLLTGDQDLRKLAHQQGVQTLR